MKFNHPLEALLHWEKNNADSVYLRQPINNLFNPFTWGEVGSQARKMASALTAMGFEPGARIAILAKNSAEWFIADLAIMLAGYISVPIYATANTETISYVLEHSDSKAIFLGKLDNWQEQEAGIASSVVRIAFPYETMTAEYQWQALLDKYQPIADPATLDVGAVMSIIYTSGSTGNPKGVVMTFQAYANASNHLVNILKPTAQDRIVSYLPLAHITERVYIQGSSLFAGCLPVSFVESLATFNQNLQSIEPTLFISVPRLWSKFQLGIYEKLPPKKLDFLLKIPLINTLIKKKIRKALGLNKARLLGCGSASVSAELLHWYQRIGMDVCEAWGMTENLAYGTLNVPFNCNKIGMIGKAGPGVELKISDVGELLFKSDAMLKEYYLQPELTAEILDQDGYLKTGDKAELDSDGYVKITGRVKDIFKTAKGKYVMPVPIETKLEDNPLIEQVCVTGAGLAQPIALMVLTEAARSRIKGELEANLKEILNGLNETLESHEKLARFVLLDDPWTVENGLMTPTLKIRRHVLEEKFAALFSQETKQQVCWPA